LKFAYVGIRVKDLRASTTFYTTLLRMRVTGRGTIEPTKGETVGLQSEDGGFVLELNYYAPGSPYCTEYAAGDGLDHLAFKVDDLDATLEAARTSGYPVLQEHEADGTRWAFIADPNGIWIELF
jgi:catechol 2,3-dioxygenase-like lactoylglutathione lyase family enzyme